MCVSSDGGGSGGPAPAFHSRVTLHAPADRDSRERPQPKTLVQLNILQLSDLLTSLTFTFTHSRHLHLHVPLTCAISRNCDNENLYRLDAHSTLLRHTSAASVLISKRGEL